MDMRVSTGRGAAFHLPYAFAYSFPATCTYVSSAPCTCAAGSLSDGNTCQVWAVLATLCLVVDGVGAPAATSPGGAGCAAVPKLGRSQMAIPQLDTCVASNVGGLSPASYSLYSSPPTSPIATPIITLRAEADPYVRALQLNKGSTTFGASFMQLAVTASGLWVGFTICAVLVLANIVLVCMPWTDRLMNRLAGRRGPAGWEVAVANPVRDGAAAEIEDGGVGAYRDAGAGAAGVGDGGDGGGGGARQQAGGGGLGPRGGRKGGAPLARPPDTLRPESKGCPPGAPPP